MFGISIKPFIAVALITAMWSLALLWIGFSQRGADVEIGHVPDVNPLIPICHLTAEGKVVSTMIRRGARATHFAHGDFNPDNDGNCLFTDTLAGENVAFSPLPGKG